MLLRIAYFEGTVRPGCEVDFDRYVQETLLPIWRRTPYALRVDVMRETAADVGAHRFPLILQIAYAERASLDEALESPVRMEGREATQGLFAFFEGRIFHAVYER